MLLRKAVWACCRVGNLLPRLGLPAVLRCSAPQQLFPRCCALNRSFACSCYYLCFRPPAVPQVLVAVMACARIGAISSTVFGGFASHELAVRLDDFKPKLILAGCVREAVTVCLGCCGAL